MTNDEVEGDREALDLLIRGFQVSRMLRLVADLGLADKIPRDGSRTVSELAADCAVLATPLLRVLRALAAFGVFRLDMDGSVWHSPRSLWLRTDAPNSLHYGARFWSAPGSWKAWGMLDVALTGGVPHEAAWSTGRFQYLREHADEARGFDAFMANFPDRRHEAIAASFDFSTAKRIVDVGAGNGEALHHILARFPAARGVVFDREDVVAAIAPQALADGRIDFEGGSFFERVPEGGDIYLIVRVLHNWPDTECVQILRNCRAAMASDARLLVVEQIIEPDPARGRPAGYLVDMQMMAMFGTARERTIPEFDELFERSGFTRQRVIATGSPVSVIEALPR
ncbi:methyltransferase [Variovorax soli]|uniref:SAM-dependent methyltransferase n=1 Tax=Variovorax soli TaxID=376815 RepID=A0ABU1N7P9_9BURK|nr:methyltransferase [Variovorax soli]MDR6534475.1 SAM-dependent methyltransferase [Variovorax soli]